MTDSGSRQEPPWRAIVAGIGAGIVLMVLGVFVSYLLVGLGAVLVAFVPLAYAARQVVRHALYVPEERYDPSAVEDLARMIERTEPHPDRRRKPRRPG